MVSKSNKIPIVTKGFRAPIVPAETPVREVPSTSFADLIRMLAEGIAEAQLSLDRSSAEMLTELADTKVSIVRNVTETIDEKGNVTYKSGEPQSVSLLELGMMPAFYQFSQATVEVAMDLQIVENESGTEETKGRKTLFANTSDLRLERKLNRDLKISSKLTATLVPVPMPLRIEPVRNTVTKAK
ncbi:MAG: hypothetical protein Q7R34_06345 [Dehalococcoidia bacterium]|nr:hypothetical protein [Dehalococcoidia bacterium]